MEEQKVNQVKLSIGKTGKPFYSQKLHYSDSWTKIPKLNYEYCIKNNLSIATEIEKDSDGNIILLKYKNENSQQRREREKNEIKPIINNGDYISLVKKTLGKDGKFYYHEASGYEKKLDEIAWRRMEEKFFDFIIERYKNAAIKTNVNENGEIIYMEYKTESKIIAEKQNEPLNNKKGCFSSFAFIFFCSVTMFYLITKGYC